jgi:DNA-binding response OmpR family regulator
MRRALIIEDDVALAQFYCRILTYQGFDCCWVSTCRDASQHLKQVCPDVVLLDVLLPDDNGLEWLKQARADWVGNPLKVIVISSGDFGLEAQARGALHYCTKPVSAKKLLSLLGEL